MPALRAKWRWYRAYRINWYRRIEKTALFIHDAVIAVVLASIVGFAMGYVVWLLSPDYREMTFDTTCPPGATAVCGTPTETTGH